MKRAAELDCRRRYDNHEIAMNQKIGVRCESLIKTIADYSASSANEGSEIDKIVFFNNVRFCILIGSAMTLSACSPPALNFTPAVTGPSSKRINASLLSTNVTVASPSELTGKINTAGVESDVASLWRSSLDDAILRLALFNDSAPNKISLVVRILELDLRDLGFKAKTTARYQLIDRNSGVIVYSTDVETTGGASDYIGDNRVRKSANRSVQANIEEFLRRIQSANIPGLN